MRVLPGVCAVTVLCCLMPHRADALTLYTDRASFEAQGTIVFNDGFEDFSSDGYTSPPVTDAGDGRAPSWSSHGVAYRVPASGTIVGTGTPEGPQTNVLGGAAADGDLLLADIDPSARYDMLGFDLGSFVTAYRDDPLHTPSVGAYVTVATNLDGWFQRRVDDLPYAPTDMRFFGFVADEGEYFTHLDFWTGKFSAEYVALDNVTLGHVAAVPEPMTLLLFLSGLSVVWGIRSLKSSHGSIN
ncbi:MAG: PEP-CTERM sorting domain-containing protein [Nitrospiria bacterium]